MGQDRHFFRVAIYGLEKGIMPEPDLEDVSPCLLGRSMIDEIGRKGYRKSSPY
jgi:hypothetical protein